MDYRFAFRWAAGLGHDNSGGSRFAGRREAPLLQTSPHALPLTGPYKVSHRARAFTDAPGQREASSLLAEIAGTASAYAPVPMDRPLALYGAAKFGALARDFLKSVGQDFVLAIDRNASLIAQQPGWSGIRVKHPDELTRSEKRLRLAVCVATFPYVPLEHALLELGFQNIVPFYDIAESFRRIHPMSNGWFAAPFGAADRQYTGNVLSRWSDDISRAHHLQFLAWRCLREEWTFGNALPLPNDDRFFISEVTDVLRDDEILLDAGAFHGDVTEAFVARTKGRFGKIVAVEPDPANRARYEAALQALLPGDRRITVYDCALSETDGEAIFHDGLGYASQLSDTGKLRVRTRAIDTLDVAPSFIKLHLEGGELAALKGARQTLTGGRPIVVATIYHNEDGIWRTARFLMDTLPRYRFLFRLHSWCGTGAVIYAIPDERRAA